MSIELRCEGCGKKLKAPRESGGKRSKCPACDHEVYIPTPEDEIEELPLAPEDAAEQEREAALLAEGRQLALDIAHDDASSVDDAAAAGAQSPGPDSASPGGASTYDTVVGFLVAMRDSDLNRADECRTALSSRRAEALQIISQIAADAIPPAQMADVPAGVYQGFLKSLRSQLQG